MRVSAGILLYRVRDGRLEVLLGHPGGPFHRSGRANWTILKGEADPGEELIAVALREFAEETGHALEPTVGPIELGTIRQKGGKLVHAWAIEGDLDPASAESNRFEIEWPPGSGRRETFPEIDVVAWLDPGEARARIKETQIPFIDRLEDRLATGPEAASEATSDTAPADEQTAT